jgi:hypothetical protein
MTAGSHMLVTAGGGGGLRGPAGPFARLGCGRSKCARGLVLG